MGGHINRHHFVIGFLFVMLVGQMCLADDTEMIGWATLGGGTTGGAGGETVTVTNKADFIAAVSDDTARIVQVVGTIHGDYNIPNVGSNKTIIGIGYDAVFSGFSVKVTDLDNVIVRNLTFTGAMPQDGLICRRATHLWIDHCTFHDAADGLLDLTDQCDYVTVSWCKFYYTGKVNRHRLACLVGSTDDAPDDVGKLNITFHHNWWGENCDQRMPRVRYGQNHIFNNYYSCTGNYYCVGGSWGFKGLVENNYFDHVNNPMMDAGNTNSGDSGTFRVEIKSVGNIFDGCTGSRSTYGDAFEPAYPYTPDAAADVPGIVQAGCGATVLIGDSTLWPVKATVPFPEDGNYNADAGSALTWRAGSTAVSHNVYFGTSADNLVSYGNQSGCSFTPEALLGDKKYYWRVDEVAEDDSVVTGDVWMFKTVAGLSPNLIHYWPFDVDFKDVSTAVSNSNHPFGAATINNDEQILGGGCLDCTLAKDGLIPGWSESSTNTVLPDAAPFTVSLWFKPTGLPASDSSACLLGTKSGTVTTALNFRIEFLSSRACRLTVGSDTAEFGNTATLNEWNHIMVSINTSGILRAWLNADGDGVIDFPVSLSNSYNGQYAGIGFYGDTPNGLHRGDYTGYLDDIAIWDVVAGLRFATVLYNEGAGRSVTGPVLKGDPVIVDQVKETRTYYGPSLVDYAFDFNGVSTSTFQKVSGADWLSVLDDGTVCGVPSNRDVGENAFTVKITDVDGAYDLAEIQINVTNTYSGVLGVDDLVGLASSWLNMNCDDCGGADLDGDSDVTIGDFSMMASHWLMDESMQLQLKFDDDAADSSVYQRTTELVGSPVFESGYLDSALTFGGSGDSVMVPGYKGIAGSSSRTCSAWIKTTGTRDILFSWGYYGTTGGKWIVRIHDNGTLRGEIQGGYIYGTTVVNDGSWHHIAIVLEDDGSADISEAIIYIDGQLDVVGASGSRIVATTNTVDVEIGGYSYYNSLTDCFEGQMDDVRIYDTALTETQIQAIVNQ